MIYYYKYIISILIMLFEKQKYQADCVANIISALKDFDFKNPNAENLKSCLEDFYKNEEKEIKQKNLSDKLNLDILMETGTGKTFTYIKTIFELNKEYGLNKFIIFIPRKAIRLGVKQNIELTKKFFFTDYNKHIKLYEYDGDKSKSKVIEFIGNTSLEPQVLILTNSAVDKKGNILNKIQDKIMFGRARTLLEGLQQIKPVIILDEPHLLKGEKFTHAFKNFNSLYLRFGATFPIEDEYKLSNMVYSLDSIQSFQNHLVKKINVSTIINSNNEIKLKSTNIKDKKVNFLIFKNGEEITKTVKLQEDIGEILNKESYKGVHINKIKKDVIFLSNNEKLQLQDYEIEEQEQRQLIKITIQKHFEKEEELFKKGIKTLSLFFIKNIDNFKGNKPIVKTIFDEEYKKARAEKLTENISKEYKEYLEQDYKDGNIQVRDGYFASSTGEEEEAKAIDLILNKKEELLSLQTPLRFIFSVWALQEGWDNPNIFNICKLAPTKKETSKRQQVGRGLRIAVNQKGKRLTYNHLEENEIEFYDINTLDIIVSGGEKAFIEGLQEEINNSSYQITGNIFTMQELKEKTSLNDREINRICITLEDNKILTFNEETEKYEAKQPIYDYLIANKEKLTFLKEQSFNSLLECFKTGLNKHSQINNSNKQQTKINVKTSLYKEFHALWKAINKKATMVYKGLNEEDLINNISNEFCKLEIEPIQILLKTQSLNSAKGIIEEKEIRTMGSQNFFTNKNKLSEYIFNIAKTEALPLSFTLKLFNKIREEKQGEENIQNNPKKAKNELLQIIKTCMHKNILQNIGYNFTNEVNIGSDKVLPINWQEGQEIKQIESTTLGHFVDGAETQNHYLYDKIVYDSNIEKEAITKDPPKVNENEITVFAKLPKISIPTPFKHYNPDFAYLIKQGNNKNLFLIVETKGYDSEQDIPQEEKRKTEYAKKFFEGLQNEMPNTKIEFKTRINTQELTTLLQSFK